MLLCLAPPPSLLFFQSSSNNVSYLANGAETTRFRQFRLLCHFSPLWIITFYLPLYIVEMGDPNHVLLVTTSKKMAIVSKCSKLKLLLKKQLLGGFPKFPSCHLKLAPKIDQHLFTYLLHTFL